MASWIVHLRVTDKLLDSICIPSSIEFVVGNVAPDSGIPNQDWSAFTPSGDVSHFKTTDADGLKDIHIHEYVEEYFSADQRRSYNKMQASFYLGYLTHLMTDAMWANEIVRPCIDKFRPLYDNDKKAWIGMLKKDWYDLDFLYLKKNPDFRAFAMYENAAGFRNVYMDFFGEDAFDDRRKYIVGFYRGEREDIQREYIYLKEEEMDRFVEECAEGIVQILKNEYQ